MTNALCHFEVMATDVERAKKFYASVLDWQFDDESMPGYALVNPGQEPSGAFFKKPSEEASPCMNVYFNVDDIDATLEKATANGGETLVPKTEIPGTGHFAMFADPEGIVVGIMKPDDG
jgi:uncharacterized protein